MNRKRIFRGGESFPRWIWNSVSEVRKRFRPAAEYISFENSFNRFTFFCTFCFCSFLFTGSFLCSEDATCICIFISQNLNRRKWKNFDNLVRARRAFQTLKDSYRWNATLISILFSRKIFQLLPPVNKTIFYTKINYYWL